MVGGDEAIYRRVKPVLDDFGDNVVYCGGIGSGSVCKLMHNCIVAVTSQAIAECFTLGAKAGVDLKPLWETVRRGAFGRGAAGIHQLPNTWFSGNFDPDWERGFFSIRLIRKDVGLATELGREYNVPMPLANGVEQILVEGPDPGLGRRPYLQAAPGPRGTGRCPAQGRLSQRGTPASKSWNEHRSINWTSQYCHRS